MNIHKKLSFPKRLNKREKVLFTVLLVLLVVLVYVFVVYRPISNAKAQVAYQQSELENQLVTLQTKYDMMVQMKAELDDIFDESATTVIPPYDNLGNLLVFLNEATAGMTVYNIDFNNTEQIEGADIVRRQGSMSFGCPSYQSARDTIEGLCKSPYRCIVNEIGIYPAISDNISVGSINVTMNITFFESGSVYGGAAPEPIETPETLGEQLKGFVIANLDE